MLYRRNCNTLLSSSLQRCYINGVCFAFQLAALWKRSSVICPWKHPVTSPPKKKTTKKEEKNKEEEEPERGGLIWTSRSYNTHMSFRTMRKRSPVMGKMDDQVTSTLDIIDMFCSMSNSRAAPPAILSREANQLSSINLTQSIDSYLVNRSTNELGFDRYGFLRTNRH